MPFNRIDRTPHFYNQLLACQTQAICVLDERGRFSYLNAAACEQFGCKEESELHGVDLDSVVYVTPANSHAPSETLDAAIQRAVAGAVVGDYQACLLRRHDGACHPISIDAAPLRHDSGAPAGVVLTLRKHPPCSAPKRSSSAGVTDLEPLTAERHCTLASRTPMHLPPRQCAQNELHRQLLDIFEHTSDIVAVHDRDGRLIYLNTAGQRNVGLSAPVQLADAAATRAAGEPSVAPLTLEDAVFRFHPPWAAERILQEGVPTAARDGLWQGETAVLRPNGEEIPTSQVIIGHRDPSGEVVQISTVLRDLSAQKRAERRRIESERHFRRMAECVHDIFWLRTATQIIYVNRAYEQIWGRSVESLYADPYSFLAAIHPEERARVEQSVHQATVEQQDLDTICRIVRPDGAVRWVHTRSHAVATEGEDPTLRAGTVRDITEQQEVLAALSAANQAKTHFLNAVSHDLRTPLNAILGFTELLLDSSLDATQRRQVELCRTGGLRLLGLIDTLLDLSCIEAGRVELQREPFDLRAFLDEQMALLGVQAEEKALALEWDVAEDVPRRVIGDTLRFGQVLFNLAINAIKFTARGGVVVRVTQHGERHLRVAVEDSGPGISAAHQALIFEPFERGAQQANRKTGSGLGLSISRNLVHLMGGELWLESVESVGSTFFFTVEMPPATEPTGASAASPETLPTSAPPHTDASGDALPGAGMRILVAEDERTNALLIRTLLERRGASVTLVADGQEALAAWQQAQGAFDLLLLDVQMPRLDGVQTVRALRAQQAELGVRHTPVAMLSAHITDDVRQECRQCGADTYLTKPISRQALDQLLCWAQGLA